MTGWLHSVDTALFRFCNSTVSNPVFDWLMPFVSNSPWFTVIILCAAAALLCKGGARGRACVLALAVTIALGNLLVLEPLKNAVHRVRPFHVLADVHLRVGMGGSFSMPSSHSGNWFSVAMVLMLYYRRTGWFMFPFAALVGFSRLYNGVHYPTDVLAGALLGSGYAVAMVALIQAAWDYAGPRWFPLWKRQLPSLANPVPVLVNQSESDQAVRDAQWLRLGWVLVAALCAARLIYLASGRIELSEDEAYQWLWSKHPALSYYSKPPLIAYAQWVGTHIWGDTQFGVRFLSPLITLALSLVLLRFMARAAGGRTAFFLIVISCACPLLAIGSILMTVDPLSVFFWTAAMTAGWRAAQPDGTTRHWLWAGLWMGFGLLSKYTNLVQFASWACFFILWPAARAHLRRPGPWLALLVTALCSLPMIIWLARHNWITVSHVASDGGLGSEWKRTYTLDFFGAEAGVLNPVFFLGALWAAVAFWRRGRRDPLKLFLFCMGAPLFVMYLLLSFHSRIEANWIAPSVVPLFCLMALYWRERLAAGAAFVRPLLAAGLGLGLFAVLIVHDTQLFNKIFHRSLPPRLDPLYRVHGWKEMAGMVDDVRQANGAPGAPAFVIGDHYGFTSQLSFHIPGAKAGVPNDPQVFYRSTKVPDNQFFYWPGYEGRKGQNAIFVHEVEKPRFRPGWFARWWNHDPDIYLPSTAAAPPIPADLAAQFESVTNLGVRDVIYRGETVRRIELFACRNLR